MRRGLRFLLAASLIFNLFAAGAVVGGLAVLFRPGLLHPHPVLLRPIRQAGDALPAPERMRFRAAMRQVLVGGEELARTARESRREAAELLVATRFDPQAVDAALARARDADIALRSRLETAAIAFASGLPADQRELLAQGLARGGPLRGARPSAKGPGALPLDPTKGSRP